MEIEAIYFAGGKKYIGVVRAYAGELKFWGILQKLVGDQEYIERQIELSDCKQLLVKDPNRIELSYGGRSEHFELIPSKLTAEQRAFIEKHTQGSVTESRELGEGELSNTLDRIYNFLSQKSETKQILKREKQDLTFESSNRLYTVGIVLAVIAMVVVLVVGIWLTVTNI